MGPRTLGRTWGDLAAYDQHRNCYYERTLELNYLQSQLDLDEVEFEFDIEVYRDGLRSLGP